MNNTLSTTAPDGQWQTWHQPGYIVAFFIIFVAIAIFAAVLILVACLPLLSIRLDRGILPSIFGRAYRRCRLPSRSRSGESNTDNDSWANLGDLSREYLPLDSAGTTDHPPRPPPPVWRPSLSSRLAWSFASEQSPMSPAPCESSNATVVIARQVPTALVNLGRALKGLGRGERQRT